MKKLYQNPERQIELLENVHILPESDPLPLESAL